MCPNLAVAACVRGEGRVTPCDFRERSSQSGEPLGLSFSYIQRSCEAVMALVEAALFAFCICLDDDCSAAAAAAALADSALASSGVIARDA